MGKIKLCVFENHQLQFRQSEFVRVELLKM
jgi:hypothetical protein